MAPPGIEHGSQRHGGATPLRSTIDLEPPTSWVGTRTRQTLCPLGSNDLNDDASRARSLGVRSTQPTVAPKGVDRATFAHERAVSRTRGRRPRVTRWRRRRRPSETFGSPRRPVSTSRSRRAGCRATASGSTSRSSTRARPPGAFEWRRSSVTSGRRSRRRLLRPRARARRRRHRLRAARVRRSASAMRRC